MRYYLTLDTDNVGRYLLMSPSIQQMRSYTWLKRHLPKEVVLEVSIILIPSTSVGDPDPNYIRIQELCGSVFRIRIRIHAGVNSKVAKVVRFRTKIHYSQYSETQLNTDFFQCHYLHTCCFSKKIFLKKYFSSYAFYIKKIHLFFKLFLVEKL